MKGFLEGLLVLLGSAFLFGTGMLVQKVQDSRLPPRVVTVEVPVADVTDRACPQESCEFPHPDYEAARELGRKDGWEEGHRTCREDRERSR